MKELTIINHPDFGQVRNVVINREPWFSGKDLCKVLGIANHNDALGRLDNDERQGVGITDPLGGTQKATFVNESGMYALIFQSRKPEAKAFKKWVTSEVLPSIRKYGYYVVPGDQASRKERNAIERAYFKELAKYITDEDIYKVAKRLHRCPDDVRYVMQGWQKDNDVMRLLQERAIANKETWHNAYTPMKMDEVLSILK